MAVGVEKPSVSAWGAGPSFGLSTALVEAPSRWDRPAGTAMIARAKALSATIRATRQNLDPVVRLCWGPGKGPTGT